MGEGQIFGMKTGDKLFFLENLSRVKQISLQMAYNKYNDDDVQWFELERLQRALVKYKEKRKIIDYTDMLVKCLNIKSFPKSDFAPNSISLSSRWLKRSTPQYTSFS